MLLQCHFSSLYFCSIFCLLCMPDPKQQYCPLLFLGIAPKTKASIVHVHQSLFVSMVLWNEIQCALIFAILHVFFFS